MPDNTDPYQDAFPPPYPTQNLAKEVEAEEMRCSRLLNELAEELTEVQLAAALEVVRTGTLGLAQLRVLTKNEEPRVVGYVPQRERDLGTSEDERMNVAISALAADATARQVEVAHDMIHTGQADRQGLEVLTGVEFPVVGGYVRAVVPADQQTPGDVSEEGLPEPEDADSETDKSEHDGDPRVEFRGLASSLETRAGFITVTVMAGGPGDRSLVPLKLKAAAIESIMATPDYAIDEAVDSGTPREEIPKAQLSLVGMDEGFSVAEYAENVLAKIEAVVDYHGGLPR